uniref:Uncharacterized protein n=1 Tax=Sphaerodactylus townsendi TaxID=933632 RepID=A0ACB8F8X6_9SAUR
MEVGLGGATSSISWLAGGGGGALERSPQGRRASVPETSPRHLFSFQGQLSPPPAHPRAGVPAASEPGLERGGPASGCRGGRFTCAFVPAAAPGSLHGVGLVDLPGGLRAAGLEVPARQPQHRPRSPRESPQRVSLLLSPGLGGGAPPLSLGSLRAHPHPQEGRGPVLSREVEVPAGPSPREVTAGTLGARDWRGHERHWRCTPTCCPEEDEGLEQEEQHLRPVPQERPRQAEADRDGGEAAARPGERHGPAAPLSRPPKGPPHHEGTARPSAASPVPARPGRAASPLGEPGGAGRRGAQGPEPAAGLYRRLRATHRG